MLGTKVIFDGGGSKLPVPLLDLSVDVPLTRILPFVLVLLFDVIVADALLHPNVLAVIVAVAVAAVVAVDDDDVCGFKTIYFDFRSWTELLKLFTSS